MNTRSKESGAAWLPIIIVLAIIVIGVGIYYYMMPATDEGAVPADTTATTTTGALDQGANVGAAVDTTVEVPATDAAN